jgi:WD40 repeat protein
VFDVASRRVVRCYEDPTGGSISSVAFSPDGAALASGCADASIKVGRLSAGHDGSPASPRLPASARSSWRRQHRRSPGTPQVLCPTPHRPPPPSPTRRPQIWDLRSDALLQHYRAHTGGVTGVTFHPSGNFLLTSSLDTTLKVRAGGTPPAYRRRVRLQMPHSAPHPPRCCKHLTSCAAPTRPPRQIWDLQEGQLFYTLHGHEGATNAAAFSPAGDYFASAGADEQVGGARGSGWDARACALPV